MKKKIDYAKFLINWLKNISPPCVPFGSSYSFQCFDWIQIRFIASLWSIIKISKMFEKKILVMKIFWLPDLKNFAFKFTAKERRSHENEKPSALKKLRPLLRRAKKVCRLESMGMCAPPPPRWEGRQSFWKWNTWLEFHLNIVEAQVFSILNLILTWRLNRRIGFYSMS